MTARPDPMPRIRRTPIPEDALFVVRGAEIPEDLVADARRFHRRFRAWGRYGLSGFIAHELGEVDALCETKLIAWPSVLVFARRALAASEIEVVPTFRRPHVTLAHQSLDQLVDGLARCEHQVVQNPYHEPEPGPLEAL